ncbi:MAG: pilus (MSHA type) biogenesis protein MshL [Gammaproteobacteria bacterium]
MTKRTTLLGALAGVLAACSGLVPPPPPSSPAHLRPDEAPGTGPIPRVVEQAPFLPPPVAAPSTEKYTVVVHEVPVKELLFALARDAAVNVDVDPGIDGIVTLNAIDQTLPQILDRIARQVDMRYEIRDQNLLVMPDRPYFRSYTVDYVNLSRDTTGTINVATQIATTGAGEIGEGGGGGGGGGAGNNNSTTAITNTANNRFWLTLTRNIQALVGETVSGGAQDLPVTGSVIPNAEAGLINVRATAKQHEAVQSFVDRVVASVQRQVLIEATVVEVTLSDRYQQGIDWRVLHKPGEDGFDAFQFLTGNLAPAAAAFAQGGGPTPPGFLGAANSFVLNYSNTDDSKRIDVVVQLLRQFGDLQVLSSPRIMALSNQPAVLKVVENVVYFEIDVEPGVATGNTQSIPAIETTAKTVPVGLVMTVTPQVNENQSVTLNMRPTISSITRFVNDPSPDLAAANTVNAVPQIQVREMESVLKVQNGQIAVLGGLIQDSVRQDSNRIPLLSDLPVFGDAFFKSHDNEYQRSELVIFLRPLVIDNPSIDADLSGYRPFLEERVERKF